MTKLEFTVPKFGPNCLPYLSISVCPFSYIGQCSYPKVASVDQRSHHEADVGICGRDNSRFGYHDDLAATTAFVRLHRQLTG